jgi:hypothetical protein
MSLLLHVLRLVADYIGRMGVHLKGELAKALMAKADELFSEAPKIHRLHVIAAK